MTPSRGRRALAECRSSKRSSARGSTGSRRTWPSTTYAGGGRLAFRPFSGRERDERPAFDSDADAVRRALQRIPVVQAAALVLRLHEGFSRAEIAELTGVTERAVKDRLERGRENFARAYRAEVGQP